MIMFNCVRIYANGDKVKKTFSTIQEKNDWVEYNQLYRFGNALFVNGVCVYIGYLDKERVLNYESELSKETV